LSNFLMWCKLFCNDNFSIDFYISNSRFHRLWA
jgi:hypothetical protein